MHLVVEIVQGFCSTDKAPLKGCCGAAVWLA